MLFANDQALPSIPSLAFCTGKSGQGLETGPRKRFNEGGGGGGGGYISDNHFDVQTRLSFCPFVHYGDSDYRHLGISFGDLCSYPDRQVVFRDIATYLVLKMLQPFCSRILH